MRNSYNLKAQDISGNAWELSIENGLFSDVQNSADYSSLDSLPVFAPGLIDCQVNGFAGIDFNNVDTLNTAKIEQVSRSLWKQGVTTYLPTIITNKHDNILHILSVFQNIQQDLQKSIGGFHIEGPFISSQDGPRGAHPLDCIAAPSLRWLEDWLCAAKQKISILTFSPHWEKDLCLKLIELCREHDIHVAIGHTHATPQQIHDVARWGCDLSTHLGNGTHQVLPRHDNYLWAQLADETLWASCIADGFHLPLDVLKIFMTVKKDRLFLVSDVTAFGGMPPGRYTAHIGGQVVLTENRKLHMANDERALAGSASSLLQAVNFLIESGLATAQEAWKLASTNPASYLAGEPVNLISIGMPANYVFISQDADANISIKKTFIRGKEVYPEYED